MSEHETATAHPLSWPSGWKRTSPYGRRESSFRQDKEKLTIVGARTRLMREVELLRVRKVILSTNVELRLDGLPRAGARVPSDPGAALYFYRKEQPIVLACDTFNRVEDNIAAIAAHIAAMRAMERYGVGTLDQMFTGYTALPGGTMTVNDWRKALGEPRSLAEAEAFYREAMKTAHPDAGGSDAKAAMLNAAIADARKVLK